jgi:DNA-binding response OmpR family regulator
MPGMSGADVYDAIRTRRPGEEHQVIFMTGGAFTAEVMAFLDGVPNQILQKPFDLDQLRAAIREVTSLQDRRRLAQASAD